MDYNFRTSLYIYARYQHDNYLKNVDRYRAINIKYSKYK